MKAIQKFDGGPAVGSPKALKKLNKTANGEEPTDDQQAADRDAHRRTNAALLAEARVGLGHGGKV